MQGASHPEEIDAPWKYQSPVRITMFVRFLKIVTIGTASAFSERNPVMSIPINRRFTGSQSSATAHRNRVNLTMPGNIFRAMKSATIATEFWSSSESSGRRPRSEREARRVQSGARESGGGAARAGLCAWAHLEEEQHHGVVEVVLQAAGG